MFDGPVLRHGEYVILEVQAPSAPIHKLGVPLLDPSSGRLYLRVRDDLAALAPSERRVLDPLADDLAAKAVEMGGEHLLVWLEDSLSNVLRLTESMFVAHVAGRSMEPRIPDGSLNVFRAPVIGSRQNKIVLVELLTEHDEAARYTIKRYASQKIQTAEDEWAHESIPLHPLNPEFQPFDLRNGEFRVIAEWVQVLE